MWLEVKWSSKINRSSNKEVSHIDPHTGLLVPWSHDTPLHRHFVCLRYIRLYLATLYIWNWDGLLLKKSKTRSHLEFYLYGIGAVELTHDSSCGERVFHTILYHIWTRRWRERERHGNKAWTDVPSVILRHIRSACISTCGSEREWAGVSGSEREWAGVTGSEREWPGVTGSEREWPGVTGSERKNQKGNEKNLSEFQWKRLSDCHKTIIALHRNLMPQFSIMILESMLCFSELNYNIAASHLTHELHCYQLSLQCLLHSILSLLALNHVNDFRLQHYIQIEMKENLLAYQRLPQTCNSDWQVYRWLVLVFTHGFCHSVDFRAHSCTYLSSVPCLSILLLIP